MPTIITHAAVGAGLAALAVLLGAGPAGPGQRDGMDLVAHRNPGGRHTVDSELLASAEPRLAALALGHELQRSAKPLSAPRRCSLDTLRAGFKPVFGHGHVFASSLRLLRVARRPENTSPLKHAGPDVPSHSPRRKPTRLYLTPFSHSLLGTALMALATIHLDRLRSSTGSPRVGTFQAKISAPYTPVSPGLPTRLLSARPARWSRPGVLGVEPPGSTTSSEPSGPSTCPSC